MNECIEWKGAIDTDGYGKQTVNSKTWRAHRYAWTQEEGEIPEGVCVLHHCDNPRCVNVEHLYLGTQADNSRDRIERRRGKWGTAHPSSKLTPNKVRASRQLYAEGLVSMRRLARLYGVSQPAIWRAIHRQTWVDVE